MELKQKVEIMLNEVIGAKDVHSVEKRLQLWGNYAKEREDETLLEIIGALNVRTDEADQIEREMRMKEATTELKANPQTMKILDRLIKEKDLTTAAALFITTHPKWGYQFLEHVTQNQSS